MQFSIQRSPLFACIFLASGFLVLPPEIASVSACRVVARVFQISASSRYKLGDGLCKGQIFAGNPIKIACISDSQLPKVLWIQKTEDLNQCEQSSPSIRRCSLNSITPCKRIRGELSVKPFLIRPYGEILAKSPLELRWVSINDADHYEIHVLGDNISKFSSTQAHLKIPPISSTTSIQIIIEAFAQNRLLSTSTTTFNLLDSNQLQQIKADLSLIDRFQGSMREKKVLKLAIYSNAGLLENAILLIQEEILLHPNSPSNIRLLGDIYLEAGLLDEANESYQNALKKASKTQDQTEINRSKWGLQQVLALRLQGEQKSPS